MTAIKALALGVGMAISIPALALAQSASFSGFADHGGPDGGQYIVDGGYEAYLTLDNTQPDPTWYPFDQAFFEYTLVITTTVDAWDNPIATIYQVSFATATFAIYKDDQTPADYANKSTFTDGDMILSGTVSGMQSTYDASQFSYDLGGPDIVITGGSDQGSASCNTLVGTDFVTINFPIGSPPAGYEEGFDVLWNCVTTSVDESNWGRVKSLYR
ncbi:hypothetical protein K8I85_03785 [bacterium]|nr:hypothetical protein [bacterium]